jgi:hypothetical protein
MTGPEDAASDLAELQRLQHQLHEGIHELINILAIMRGEMDFAIDHARTRLEAFYQMFPDFGGPMTPNPEQASHHHSRHDDRL